VGKDFTTRSYKILTVREIRFREKIEEVEMYGVCSVHKQMRNRPA
jgi:hypothetical protein